MLKLPILLLPYWLVFGFSPAWAIDPEQLLEPDEAFQFHAERSDADRLMLAWDIADGYYLYRHKFKFISQNPDIKTGEPVFPAGQNKQDQHFGSVEIYRDRLEVELPIQRQAATSTKLTVEVTYQGCADIGVCYMPIQKVIAFDLADSAITDHSNTWQPNL